MVSETPTDGRCNAELDGGYCEGWQMDNGRCYSHGGRNEDDDRDPGGVPPEKAKGNGNAESHGLTADREQWFERHRDEVGEDVRLLAASYLEDAPFGWSDTAKVHKLVEVVIDQVRLQQSNEYLDEFLEERVVGTTEGGAPIRQLEENPGHLPRARIKRDNIRILKDLGILDDPASQQAAAQESTADALREFMSHADNP
jgi:hypothetical protein